MDDSIRVSRRRLKIGDNPVFQSELKGARKVCCTNSKLSVGFAVF